MIVAASQAVAVPFTTNSSTGEAINATGTPTGVLYVNGTATAVVVTVTNVSTGLYMATFTTPPTIEDYDSLYLVISATVDEIALKRVIFEAFTQGPTAGSVDAEVTSFSSAALQQLQAAPIQITQPLGENAAVSITRGMDYNEDDDRAIVWTDTSSAWPVLTSATITVTAFGKSGQGRPIKVFSGSVKTATGATKQVQLELTAAQTQSMAAGDWVYGVKAVLSSGNAVDLIRPIHQWKVVDYPTL